MQIGGTICLNGRYLPAREAAVSALDRGLLYGMGLFETIGVYGGSPADPDRHLSRLFASARELGLEVPFSQGDLAGMVRRTAVENGLERGGVRLTLTAGTDPGGPVVSIAARESPYRPDQYLEGIRAGFSSIRRNQHSPLVRHKTLNYLENILARREAGSAGWGEAFFLNTLGNLAEGAVSNIFLVKGGKVVTPDLASGVLPGITRRRVIEACAGAGLPVEERVVRPAELIRSGECFVTNSLMGVMPVVLVGEAVVGDGRPGRVTRAIMAVLEIDPEG